MKPISTSRLVGARSNVHEAMRTADTANVENHSTHSQYGRDGTGCPSAGKALRCGNARERDEKARRRVPSNRARERCTTSRLGYEQAKRWCAMTVLPGKLSTDLGTVQSPRSMRARVATAHDGECTHHRMVACSSVVCYSVGCDEG